MESAIPVLASAMDAVVDAAFAGALARLGGLAVMNLEGIQTRYDAPAEIQTGWRGSSRGMSTICSRARMRLDPRRPRSPAHRGDPGCGFEGRRGRHPGAARKWDLLSAEHGADLFLVEAGQLRSPPGHRLRPALPGRVHPIHAHPRCRGQHHERRCGVCAHGAGSRGGLRGRRPRRRVHHARGAGDRPSPRSQPSATWPPRETPSRPRPGATSRSSPTAGCAAAASWPRRWPPARTP